VRVITIHREQYSVTVHLFIGTGRSPDKITFMPLTSTLNHKANYQGLNSLFPLRSVSFFIFAVIPSRSSFSCSFGFYSHHFRLIFSCHACLCAILPEGVFALRTFHGGEDPQHQQIFKNLRFTSTYSRNKYSVTQGLLLFQSFNVYFNIHQ
jgi:hypothetical protein